MPECPDLPTVGRHSARHAARSPTAPRVGTRQGEPVAVARPAGLATAARLPTPVSVVGRIQAARRRLRSDHLVRNSLYLIFSSGMQGALGLVFWLIAARLYSVDAIGRGSSLIAAVGVIASAALLGLNTAFVRYLPIAANRDALLTSGLLLVTGAGAALAILYVVLIPVAAPRLAFIERPVLAVGFVLLAAASAANLLTDAVFIAARRAGWNAVIDGGIGGVSRVVGILALAGAGGYGVFCASSGGLAVAALASMILMIGQLRWRPTLHQCSGSLRPLVRFSGASYAANLAGALPGLVVPVIVLDRLGAASAAYYFVGFQLASILFAAITAVEQTFLAEGAYAGGSGMPRDDRRALLQRSRRLLALLCGPACLALIAVAHWVLLAFGTRYSQHGTVSLMLIASAAIPIAANYWLWTVLRLAGKLRALVLGGAVYAGSICGLSWLLAPHGLGALAAAWPLGSLISAGVSAIPSTTSARHRRVSAHKVPAH
jgi:O-antigen/teichoic acid export membrane protein